MKIAIIQTYLVNQEISNIGVFHTSFFLKQWKSKDFVWLSHLYRGHDLSHLYKRLDFQKVNFQKLEIFFLSNKIFNRSKNSLQDLRNTLIQKDQNDSIFQIFILKKQFRKPSPRFGHTMQKT